jgi:hypothetical protein
MGPYPFPGESVNGAVCDGLLQRSEGDVVDGPFDQDGDGFVDGADPGCAGAYAASLLDCDDDDPVVHPGAGEVPCNGIDDDCDPSTADRVDADDDGYDDCEDCDDRDPNQNPGETEVCDGVDNDCDGDTDPGCIDYAGYFLADPPLSYTCGFGAVTLVLDQLRLLWTPPFAELRNLSGGTPGTMDGTLQEDGAFELETSVVLGTPASCDEYYRLVGAFSDADHFTATFEATFVGNFCGNCEDQAVEVTGQRY